MYFEHVNTEISISLNLEICGRVCISMYVCIHSLSIVVYSPLTISAFRLGALVLAGLVVAVSRSFLRVENFVLT